jgi:hypothetical protein
MKKIAIAGLLAMGLIAVAEQQASAWVNQRFSIGLNYHRQSGGNNFGWGLYRNGQPPGPESFHGAPFSPTPAPFVAPAPHGHGYMPQTQPQPARPMMNYAGQYANPYTFASYPQQTQYYYYYPAPAYYFYFYGE